MFTFDGRKIPAEEGMTVSAALVRAGDPGAVFCAIGVCFACLVSVNGGPPQRGCLTVAGEADVVSRVR